MRRRLIVGSATILTLAAMAIAVLGIWSAFSRRLREEVDLEGLTFDLTAVVGSTLRSATVSVVLIEEGAQ